MRLYSDEEVTTEKKIIVEDYSCFKKLLSSKWLFVLLIAYTAYIVINCALAIIDGGYIMGIINIIVHGLICASLWLFRNANKNNDTASFSTNGIKMFQISHAVKYVVVFLMVFIGFFMLVFSWINKSNEITQTINKYISQTNKAEELAKAYADRKTNFWSYFGLFFFYVIYTIVILVYYKAVMSFVDGLSKYQAKGTHCWKELKFLAIYLFVTAGLLVLSSVLILTGTMTKLLGYLSSVSMANLLGGLGIYSTIGRLIFALLCVFMGLACLKGYKVLSTTTTSEEKIVTNSK